jgi:hypothetical protein
MSLPRRPDAVAAGEQESFLCAAEKSKFYPLEALNYPGARNHGCCQLEPASSRAKYVYFFRVITPLGAQPR